MDRAGLLDQALFSTVISSTIRSVPTVLLYTLALYAFADFSAQTRQASLVMRSTLHVSSSD